MTNTITCTTTLAAKRQLHGRYILLTYLFIYDLMTPKVAQHTQCDITGLSEHSKYRKCTESLRALIWSTGHTGKKYVVSVRILARQAFACSDIYQRKLTHTHTQRYKTKCVSVSGALQKEPQSQHGGKVSYSGAMHVV